MKFKRGIALIVLCILLSDVPPQFIFLTPIANANPDTSYYYPSGYSLLGSTTYISGSLSDLQSDNGVYMTFRSYGSASSVNYPISNMNFTGSATGWSTTTSVTAGTAAYGYDSANGNPPPGSGAGSYYHKATSSASKAADITFTTETSFTYTLGQPISVFLSYAYSVSGTSFGASSSIIVRLVKPDATTVDLDTVYLPASAVSWTYKTVSVSTTHFTQSGTYKLQVVNRLTAGAKGTANYVQLNFDDIGLKITYYNEYTCEVEFTGSSPTYNWDWVEWKIDSAWTVDSVSVTLQFYNWATSSYPTSGDGFISYTSGSANVDQTQSQNITANPNNFRETNTGNWKIKVKGVKTTSTQFDFKGDLVQLYVKYQAPPSGVLVGTSQFADSTKFPSQRKSFYANGLFWVFYSSDFNMVYKTSTDGLTWSDATIVRSCIIGQKFSVWFDGTYVHYVYSTGTPLYYRRGIPNSNGTITWSAPEQEVSVSSGNYAWYPHISVDSNGYAWVGYEDCPFIYYYPYVVRSGNNNGTWGSTPAGFPYQLSSIWGGDWFVSVIPLTSGKMLAIYALDGYTIKARRWDGSAWGPEVTTNSSILGNAYYSAVAQGDDVHLVFLSSTCDIIYTKYTYSSNSFGTEITVQGGVTSSSAPALSIDSSNNLYCFWAGSPTASHIYYKKRDAGTGNWDTSPTDWLTESTGNLHYNSLTCFYQAWNNYIGLAYTIKITDTLFNIKFGYLTLLAPEYSRDVSQSISTLFTISKQLEFSKVATQSLTYSSSGSKLIEVLKSASQGITSNWIADKVINFQKSVIQNIGFASSTAQLYEFLRGATQSITYVYSGVRQIEINILPNLSVSFNWIGNRLTELYISVLQSITSIFTSSKISEFLKGSSLGINFESNTIRLIEILKPVSQSITTVFSTTRLAEFFASISQSIDLTLSGVATTIQEFFKDANLSILSTWDAIKELDIFKSTSQSITTAWQTSRLFETAGIASQEISLSSTVSRIGEFFASLSQTITTSFTTSKLMEFLKSGSQTIDIGLVTTRIAELEKSATQFITTSLSVGRAIEILKPVSQSITATFSTGKLSEYLKFTFQSITLDSSVSKISELFKSVSQTITTVLSTSRVAEYIISVSQNIELTLTGIGETIQHFFIEVSQSISVLSNAIRQLNIFRLPSISITFQSNAQKFMEFFVSVSQTMSYIFSTTKETLMAYDIHIVSILPSPIVKSGDFIGGSVTFNIINNSPYNQDVTIWYRIFDPNNDEVFNKNITVYTMANSAKVISDAFGFYYSGTGTFRMSAEILTDYTPHPHSDLNFIVISRGGVIPTPSVPTQPTIVTITTFLIRSDVLIVALGIIVLLFIIMTIRKKKKEGPLDSGPLRRYRRY